MMADVETATVLSDYADYMAASEEPELYSGWNYAFIKEAGLKNTEELLAVIMADYETQCQDYLQKNNLSVNYSFSYLALNQIKALTEAIDTVFAKLQNPNVKNIVIRNRMYDIGYTVMGESYDRVDLYELAEALSEVDQASAEKLRDLLDQAVIGSVDAVGLVKGLSIYYPYHNIFTYELLWKAENTGQLTDFSSYIECFTAAVLERENSEAWQTQLKLMDDGEQSWHIQLDEAQQAQCLEVNYYILRVRENQSGEKISSRVSSGKQADVRNGIQRLFHRNKIQY